MANSLPLPREIRDQVWRSYIELAATSVWRPPIRKDEDHHRVTFKLVVGDGAAPAVMINLRSAVRHIAALRLTSKAVDEEVRHMLTSKFSIEWAIPRAYWSITSYYDAGELQKRNVLAEDSSLLSAVQHIQMPLMLVPGNSTQWIQYPAYLRGVLPSLRSMVLVTRRALNDPYTISKMVGVLATLPKEFKGAKDFKVWGPAYGRGLKVLLEEFNAPGCRPKLEYAGAEPEGGHPITYF